MNRVVMCPNPFLQQRIEATIPEGRTITQMIRAIGFDPDPLHARVFIDDRKIEKAQWEYVTPKAGELVTVRAVPQGGGGGSKDVIRLVALIAVAAVAIYVSGPAGASLLGSQFAAGAAGLAVTVVGSLVVNGLIPEALC
jgi:hypothetical protein